MNDKPNPNLTETERTVLAVLLNDAHAIIPTMDVLNDPEQFGEARHQAIYGAILALTQESIVPNVHTVADKCGLLLEDLQDLAKRFTTKANKEVLYLADVVARAAKRRKLQQAIREAGELAGEPTEDLEGLAFTAGQMIIGAVGDTRERDPKAAEVGKRLDSEIAQLGKGGLIGFNTSSPWLNDKTGGMCGSHVWMVTAPYKGRKTTFARNLVISACRAGASVDVFALEGDQGSTYAGLWAMLATERLHKWQLREEMVLSETFVRRGRRSESQADALAQARTELDGWNLRIYDGRDHIGGAAKVAHKIKRDRFMFGLNVFVLDYLQLLGEGKLFERVESATHMLQKVIVEQGVTGVILAQLNEATIWSMDSESESYSPGVKGGGDPAAAADFLIRTKYDAQNTPDELTAQLKLARHAQPGSMRYQINRQSGLILKEIGEG